MIAQTNAVINPRAMMVHFDDTSLADAAMVSTGWLEILATPTRSIPLFIQAIHIYTYIALDVMHKMYRTYRMMIYRFNSSRGACFRATGIASSGTDPGSVIMAMVNPREEYA
jgi:hypothetical protein